MTAKTAGPWLAGLGAVCIVVQAIVYLRWIGSPAFRPVPLGPDLVPPVVRVAIRTYEVISLVTLAVVLPWFVGGILRTRRIDPLRLLMIGWLSAYWLDPWLDFLRPMFTYNAYATNFGCWCAFIPGWSSPVTRIAEPLLIDAPSYFYTFAGTAAVALWAMRFARNRWPFIGTFGLVLAGFAGVWLSMGLLDVAATRYLGFDAWPLAFRALSFWGGRYYQFPIYEFLLFPSTFVACAWLLLRMGPDGRTAIETGLDRFSPRLRETMRILAFVAFCNLLNFGYTTSMGVHALFADPWPSDMPSWLASGQETGR